MTNKTYAATVTQYRGSIHKATKPRDKFPRRVFVVLGICAGILFVGVAYVGWFV